VVAPRTDPTTTYGNRSVALSFTRPAWFADALCREPDARAEVGMHHVDAEFNKRAAAAALQVCGRCLVLDACREYAVADSDLLGIFGGTDSAARKAIRSNRNRQGDSHAAP
jgi:WhiB family redox-sensing transcriptional regulator